MDQEGKSRLFTRQKASAAQGLLLRSTQGPSENIGCTRGSQGDLILGPDWGLCPLEGVTSRELAFFLPNRSGPAKVGEAPARVTLPEVLGCCWAAVKKKRHVLEAMVPPQRHSTEPTLLRSVPGCVLTSGGTQLCFKLPSPGLRPLGDGPHSSLPSWTLRPPGKFLGQPNAFPEILPACDIGVGGSGHTSCTGLPWPSPASCLR